MAETIESAQDGAKAPEINGGAVSLPIYDPLIAAKKIGWGVSKLLAAKALAMPIVEPLCNAFNAAGVGLQPYGITFHADLKLLQNGLPVLLFAGLVSLHDAAKVKTGKSWL